MSSRTFSSPTRLSVLGFTLMTALCGFGFNFASAQKTAQISPYTVAPRLQLFGGYSFLYPNATASGVRPGGVLPVSSCLCANPSGFGGGATLGLTPWLGVTVDGSKSFGGGGSTPAQQVGQWNSYDVSAGPTITYPGHRLAPFIEGLVGVQHLYPALFPPGNSSVGVLAGGGVDLHVSKHIGVRLFRADYDFANHSYGAAPNTVTANLRGLRVQGGLLVTFGSVGHHKPTGAQPIREAAAAPAPRAAVVAAAPAALVAPLPEQTTLALAASPATVLSGEASTINATGFSLQNRPLVYSYQSSAGVLSGTGNTVMLSTAGVGAGSILITGKVVDNFGGSAIATTNVVVTQPVIVQQMPLAVGTISFAAYPLRPTRVDNVAKAQLDEVALDLQHNSTSTLVLVGSFAAGEHQGERRAAQRAVNTKAYLVGTGVDASRIAVYTGPRGDKSVKMTVLPAGVKMDTTGLTPVDEKLVKPRKR